MSDLYGEIDNLEEKRKKKKKKRSWQERCLLSQGKNRYKCGQVHMLLVLL